MTDQTKTTRTMCPEGRELCAVPDVECGCERVIYAQQQQAVDEGGEPMSTTNDRTTQTTASLRWVQHASDFASLMLGRVELAQITRGNTAAGGHWFWTLRFCRTGERPCFSAPTESEARAVAEEHARKVINDADS